MLKDPRRVSTRTTKARPIVECVRADYRPPCLLAAHREHRVPTIGPLGAMHLGQRVVFPVPGEPWIWQNHSASKSERDRVFLRRMSSVRNECPPVPPRSFRPAAPRTEVLAIGIEANRSPNSTCAKSTAAAPARLLGLAIGRELRFAFVSSGDKSKTVSESRRSIRLPVFVRLTFCPICSPRIGSGKSPSRFGSDCSCVGLITLECPSFRRIRRHNRTTGGADFQPIHRRVLPRRLPNRADSDRASPGVVIDQRQATILAALLSNVHARSELPQSKANRARPFPLPVVQPDVQLSEIIGHIRGRRSVGQTTRVRKPHGLINRAASGEKRTMSDFLF